MAPIVLPAAAIQIMSSIIQGNMAMEAEREVTARQVELAKIEAMMARERLEAQVEVATLIVNTARHVFDRKMDFVEASFREMMRMISETHKSLLAERETIYTGVLTAKSKQDHLIHNRRLGEVDRQIASLEHSAKTLHADMLAYLTHLEVNFSSFPGLPFR